MSALDRLMRKVGIEPAFRDVAGTLQRISPQVALGLLRAMGFAVAEEGDVEAVLASMDAQGAGRILPPVVVTTRPGLPLSIPVRVPRSEGTSRWEIRQEGGACSGGQARLQALEPLNGDEPLGGNPDEQRGLRQLVVDIPEALGRHRLRIELDGMAPAETSLLVAPERCWVPEGLGRERRLWGVSIQLYLLRSSTNWGIGDFGDLKRLVGTMAGLGAAVVGLNPLHAMFLDDPEQASPYSPTSRLFLNVLYIDVTAVPGFAMAPAVRSLVDEAAFQADLAASRDAILVDYRAVARAKLPVLEALHRAFLEGATQDDREALASFRREKGEALERFCRHQALREHFAREAPERADWRRWPEALREAGSPEVERFAQEHRERIDLFAWLQWTADRQLGEAAAEATARGMEIGLYRDLAVGAAAGGAESWSNPRTVLPSVHVGAPPDALNWSGQDWGLPAFDPRALREEAYAGFTDIVRANMRHAGGLRIDHVMALQHLYMIPEGRPPGEGAYVAFPMSDMIAVLALESQRRRCLVVGEDLGTVPEGFRERMTAAGILSYRVVVFEREADGAFTAPQNYPAQSLAVLGSHDLATLRGWWEGRDIVLKAKLVVPADVEEETRHRAERERDRCAFIDALAQSGLLKDDEVRTDSPFSLRLAEAAHAFLALTSSGLAIAQLDDLLGEVDQVNLPGTTDEHANWRRKYSLSIEGIAADPRIRALAASMSRTWPGLPAHSGAPGNRC